MQQLPLSSVTFVDLENLELKDTGMFLQDAAQTYHQRCSVGGRTSDCSRMHSWHLLW